MIFSNTLQDLSQKEVHVWLIDLDKPLDMNDNTFDNYEIEKAKGFLVDKPREIYLTCRYALKLLLACYTKENAENIYINSNQYGKPKLQYPNNRNIHFNVSHSKSLGCIAFNLGEEIGIDTEDTKGHDLEDAMPLFMTEQEINKALHLNEKKNDALCHLWTQKEAYVKEIGKGFQYSPLNFEGHVTTNTQLTNVPIHNRFINSFFTGSQFVSICTPSKISVKLFSFNELYSSLLNKQDKGVIL